MLLEVMVAMVILGVAGTASVLGAREALSAVERARTLDAEMRSAAALMSAATLWTREDLDRHLGFREQGPWLLWVGRPEPDLYEVAVTDTTAARNPVLRTFLFRADSLREAR